MSSPYHTPWASRQLNCSVMAEGYSIHMSRKATRSNIVSSTVKSNLLGVNQKMILGGINFVYEVLDKIDLALLESGSERLTCLVELANLSAVVGNLFRKGFSQDSNGRFIPNSPHTYPDLLATTKGCGDMEIKVSLENNKPKGHLVKPGPHMTVRYVLGGPNGEYQPGKHKRGDVVWIWEVRLGQLSPKHFNFSNTEGDSGKTAVINADGMNALKLAYCNLKFCHIHPMARSTNV